MSYSFLDFFELDINFTIDDLDKSYNKKIKEINEILNIDKEYYKDTINKCYLKAIKFLNKKNISKSSNNKLLYLFDNYDLHIENNKS
jgi:hypothetical protein